MNSPRVRIASQRAIPEQYADLLRYHDRLTPGEEAPPLSPTQLAQAAEHTLSPWPFLPPPRFAFGTSDTSDLLFPGIQEPATDTDAEVPAGSDASGSDASESDPVIVVEGLDATTLQPLRLPHLDSSRSAPGSEFVPQPEMVRHGAGPIARRATLRTHLLRQATHGTPSVGTLIPDDFRHIQETASPIPSGGAVLVNMMDTSGSMGSWERRMSKTLIFWATRMLRLHYPSVHLLWIAHDVHARILSETAFFARASSGGTCASTAFARAHTELDCHYPLAAYHRYAIYLSDGGNLSSDNGPALKKALDLAETCTGFFLGELHDTARSPSALYHSIAQHTAIRSTVLSTSFDIVPTLQTWFR